jgi:hypothetical protein
MRRRCPGDAASTLIREDYIKLFGSGAADSATAIVADGAIVGYGQPWRV